MAPTNQGNLDPFLRWHGYCGVGVGQARHETGPWSIPAIEEISPHRARNGQDGSLWLTKPGVLKIGSIGEMAFFERNLWVSNIFQLWKQLVQVQS